MFKKLVNLLFEEEEIEELDEGFDTEEPIIEVRTKKAEPELPKKAEPVTLKEEKTTEAEPVLTAQEESAPVATGEKPVENKGIMIDLEPAKPAKVNVPKFTQKRETEYEFSQVISPIYGVLDDEKKTVSELSSPSQPKRKVVMNNSLLGTVISPIYGVTKESKNVSSVNRVVKEEEVENVSLDDLLSMPAHQHVNDEYEKAHLLREEDPNDLDSLIRSLKESEPAKPVQHKMVESQLNLFGDEE